MLTNPIFALVLPEPLVEWFYDAPDGVLVISIIPDGVWDAASSGNLLFHTDVDTPKAVLAGDTISVAIGAVTVTLA